MFEPIEMKKKENLHVIMYPLNLFYSLFYHLYTDNNTTPFLELYIIWINSVHVCMCECVCVFIHVCRVFVIFYFRIKIIFYLCYLSI